MTTTLLLHMAKDKNLSLEFKDIYLEFNDLVRSITYRMTGPSYLDDIVQDVFIKVWKNLKNFKKQSSLKTWIYRITLNTCYDFLKKAKLPISKATTEQVSTNSSVEIAEAINKALAQLSPQHRAAIVLLSYEGLSLQEASNIENTNAGTMKSRLSNAKKQMIQILKTYGVHHA